MCTTMAKLSGCDKTTVWCTKPKIFITWDFTNDTAHNRHSWWSREWSPDILAVTFQFITSKVEVIMPALSHMTLHWAANEVTPEHLLTANVGRWCSRVSNLPIATLQQLQDTFPPPQISEPNLPAGWIPYLGWILILSLNTATKGLPNMPLAPASLSFSFGIFVNYNKFKGGELNHSLNDSMTMGD